MGLSYLITDKAVDPDLCRKMKSKIFKAAETGGYMGKRARDYPYPVGVTKSYGWGDGWSLVSGNEFSTWSILVWNVCMHGFLYHAGQSDFRAVQ
ncbi:MAG: hypothetical protein KKG10_17585 [Proteobacteria bacterium]|nr:hypothetical protein [Pseudomonadota bacterium]